MPAKKLKSGEAAVVVREHEGRTITSVGVVYGRKVNLGNYEVANLKCSMWADVAGEDDANIQETLGWLRGLARGEVEAQPELAGRQAPRPSPPAAPLPQKQASKPPREEPTLVVDEPQPPKSSPTTPREPQGARKPAEPTPGPSKAADAPTGAAEIGAGRELTKRIVSFGTPKMTAGITAETFGELLALTPDFEHIAGKGSALTELAELCPEAYVVHQGEQRYSRLALNQEEGEMLLKHFTTVVEGVKKGA